MTRELGYSRRPILHLRGFTDGRTGPPAGHTVYWQTAELSTTDREASSLPPPPTIWLVSPLPNPNSHHYALCICSIHFHGFAPLFHLLTSPAVVVLLMWSIAKIYYSLQTPHTWQNEPRISFRDWSAVVFAVNSLYVQCALCTSSTVHQHTGCWVNNHQQWDKMFHGNLPTTLNCSWFRWGTTLENPLQ